MSAGGAVGQIYARRHPEALAGLIVSSTGPCFRCMVADPACVLNPRHAAWRAALAAAGLLDGANEEPGPDAAAAEATEWQAVAGGPWALRRRGGPALFVSPTEPPPPLRRVLPSLWAFDARPWLGGVRAPTLVMCGTADPLVPLDHARAVHAAIPGSELVAVEGAGHVPLIDRPAEVGAAVRRFLAARAA
jgi:pimeloyl-ACP methyl ester carboxylesterase